MNKIASRNERVGAFGTTLKAFFQTAALRLLLLLLIAEAPLVVFTTALAFQNQTLRASDALAQAGSVQHAVLADELRGMKGGLAVASAAGNLPQAVLNGSHDCTAILRAMVATNDRIDQAVISNPDGSTRCSAEGTTAAPGPGDTSWVAAMAKAPNAINVAVVAGSILVARKLVLDGGTVALIAVRLRNRPSDNGRDAHTPPPSPPSLWLRRSGAWMPIGRYDPHSLPDDPGTLDTAHAQRRPAGDGRAFLYESAPLPKEFGDPSAILLAASDVRHAVSATRNGLVLLIVEMAGFFLAELVLVMAGVSVVVSMPLRRFNAAVRRWRQHGAFDAEIQNSDPSEVRELKQMFRQAAVSLDEREAELRSSVAQQELLMQEIHHRVKNNLQIIASLLNLQASRIKLPEAQAEFQSARDRVRALATLHRHLYADGALHMINLRAFFAELCSQLFQGFDELEGERISVEVDAPEIEISSDQAVPIALIVTETVGNAIKYAFPGKRRGTIRLGFRVESDKQATLTISDDGIGLADHADGEAAREGLGLQLVRGFARQLGSTLVVSRAGGTCYRVDMTLQRHRTYQPKPGGRPRGESPA